jgi:hypothetical protein
MSGKLFSFFFVFLLSVSCNSSDFKSGGGGARKSADVKPVGSSSLKTEDFNLKGEVIDSGKVDIVFVVDTSGSMYQEKELLEKNMASFIQEFQNKNASVDYQIFLIGSDFNFPPSSGKLQIVDEKVFSNDALAVLHNFLAFGLSGHTVRPNSIVEAVIITDDNAYGDDGIPPIMYLPQPGPNSGSTIGTPTKATTLNAAEFVTAMSKIPNANQLHINGLVGKREGSINDWCDITEAGTEYETLASMPQYNGLMEDLCTEDWSPLLSRLAASIIKRVEEQSIQLSGIPDLTRGYQVTLNGSPIEKEKVRISSDGKVSILDDSLKRQRGVLTIKYSVSS